METYLVGGAVRDALLGLPVSDRDWVVTGATSEDLISQGFRQIGNDFPCFLHPQTQEEYALARTERKSGSGHQGFICDFGPHTSLEEDLSRRDLTINAIAKDNNDRLIDPYGGIDDLHNKLLRHVSPAFREDPLRVLRVARFAARFKHLGFTIHNQTLKMMRDIADSGELQTLTAERVWTEIQRALAEASPWEFFAVLQRCAALRALLPELGELALDKLPGASTDPLINWAILTHHLPPEVAGTICRRLKTPREYLDLSKLVTVSFAHFKVIMQMDATALLKLIMTVDGIRRPQRLATFACACASAAPATTTDGAKADPRVERLLTATAIASQVDTTSLQEGGFKGSEFAALLQQLRQEAIASWLVDGSASK